MCRSSLPSAEADDFKLFVCDEGNHRVQVFNSDYSVKSVIGRGQGSNPGQLQSVACIALQVGPSKILFYTLVSPKVYLKAEINEFQYFELYQENL